MTQRYADYSALTISGPDEDGILDICIDTPGKLNAVDEAKHLALADAVSYTHLTLPTKA